MWRDDAWLLDMLIAAREASVIVAGVTEEEFRRSTLHQNALAYVLQKIGEAAGRVSEETRAKHRDLDWLNIINFRHRLVHDYKNIDLDKVWFVIRTEIPALIDYLERIVPPEEPEP